MNFLAHEFLSQGNKGIRVGNFLADFIRGNDLEKYPKDVKTGILLHRSIDEFTDHHPVVSRSKKRLYALQGKYTAVVWIFITIIFWEKIGLSFQPKI
jgi:acyl carrier protein phosphodiesterase